MLRIDVIFLLLMLHLLSSCSSEPKQPYMPLKHIEIALANKSTAEHYILVDITVKSGKTSKNTVLL